MKTIAISFSVLCLLHLSASMFAQQYMLPDGSKFESWDDQTSYTKTYHVNQHHPSASDDNPGTFEKPFKSINQAAETVKAGEKVLVYSGVYRESVHPLNAGSSRSKMISYQAAPGASVIIKGSIIYRGEWQPSTAVLGFHYARDIWQAPLDRELFAPFYLLNANEEEMALMPWAEKWTGKVPYTLKRGLVFQDGKRMTQLANYEDLIKLEGTFWVDEKNQLIHIHPYNNINPNDNEYELTNRQQLFVPQNASTHYLHVSGFIFEHAGNGFPRIGTGAVFVNGGHHWIFENNIIRNVNSVGIEAGARIKEKKVSSDEENERAANHPGGFMIKNNKIHHCGTGGIQGHTVRNALLENNHIHHIGWQHAEQYWECAGVKMLRNTNNVVARNVVHDVNEASGIWLDWDNRNSRVTGNLLYNIGRTSNGAIFIEASIKPNMIDNNFIMDTRGPAITLYDTDEAVVCYNFIAKADIPISSRINTDRSLDGVPLSSENNIISHNLFYKNRSLPVMDDPDNISDFNVFVKGDLTAWQNTGFDKKSVSIDAAFTWNEQRGSLIVDTPNPLPLFQESPHCDVDFWSRVRMGDHSISAPWQFRTKGKARILLNRKK
jgi:hypothetical protein